MTSVNDGGSGGVAQEAAREILRAKFRSVFAQAYAHRLRQGSTLDLIAARVGITPGKFYRLMMAPRSLSLNDVALIIEALDFELQLNLVDPAGRHYSPTGDDEAQAPATGAEQSQ